jgi:hypothetical protein
MPEHDMFYEEEYEEPFPRGGGGGRGSRRR